ncbi:uncharacterized protein F4822DRAFT_130483 [Hypoxylon trugodes]|uniref:uncharacterized protein n=1 Tax=Hypoxylon trugodes TaxID=326681 RepID=UPI0021A16F32|nr:uncharacterized protein F4822DRAFT_130483 [Hypoxylon trugodes]KAI1392485.1 hypothetical protein F4822DRAFT_130483 [Hypoxylon trugodes]
MDRVTILGIAANVSQFINYGLKLISASKEIRTSVAGCTDRIAFLDEVYGQLRDLSSKLQSRFQLGATSDLNLVGVNGSICSLAHSCESYCDELLNITSKIKGKVGRPKVGIERLRDSRARAKVKWYSIEPDTSYLYID